MIDKATALRRKAFLDDEVGYDYITDEYIIDEYHHADFSEFVISTGGDVSRYRVYGNKRDEMKAYYIG